MNFGGRKALWKLTELWKNQKTVFPQLLEPSVHSSHNAGCCWSFLKHNFSSTPSIIHQGAKRRFGDCARKVTELTPGDLLRVASATEAAERRSDRGAEVSIGHSRSCRRRG